MKQNDDNRDRSCARKIKLSKAAADRAVKRMQAEGRTGIGRYKCRFCGRYHVGHERGAGARQRNQAERRKRRRVS